MLLGTLYDLIIPDKKRASRSPKTVEEDQVHSTNSETKNNDADLENGDVAVAEPAYENSGYLDDNENANNAHTKLNDDPSCDYKVSDETNAATDKETMECDPNKDRKGDYQYVLQGDPKK